MADTATTSATRSRRSRRLRGDTGATVVEYAMGLALVLVVSLASLEYLEDSASDEFDGRADRAGAPDLSEGSADGGTTDGGTGSGGTDGPPPVTQEVAFGGFENVRSTGNNPWRANLSVQVDDTSGNGLSGVTVSGTWSYLDGSTPVTVEAVCNQTNGSGSCQFQLSDIPPGVQEVTFTMDDISGGVPPVVYSGGPQTQVVAK
jgi:Flp pilus assembly pilin Flp